MHLHGRRKEGRKDGLAARGSVTDAINSGRSRLQKKKNARSPCRHVKLPPLGVIICSRMKMLYGVPGVRIMFYTYLRDTCVDTYITVF